MSVRNLELILALEEMRQISQQLTSNGVTDPLEDLKVLREFKGSNMAKNLLQTIAEKSFALYYLKTYNPEIEESIVINQIDLSIDTLETYLCSL